MNKQQWKKCGVVAALAASMAVTPWALAAEPMKVVERESIRTDAAIRGNVIEGSQFIGLNLENAQDENVGEINDIVVDLSNGRIAYAVVGFGSWLGTGYGGKLFAVPWQAIRYQGAGKPALFNVSKEKLKGLQGFDSNQWPDVADTAFGAETYKHYGFEPYWNDRNAHVNQNRLWINRLSKLDDRSVQNAAGERLGQIEELMIDAQNGRIAYALLQYGGVMGIKEKNVAVPWSALQLNAEKKLYVLDASKTQLEAAAVPEKGPFNYNDEAWARRVHTQFQREPYWETYGYADDGTARGDMGHAALFNSGRDVTITGKIASVDRYTLRNGGEGVRAKVTTDDNRTVFVDLGNRAALADTKLNTGDTVKLTGREVTIFRAMDVQINSQAVKVRHD